MRFSVLASGSRGNSSLIQACGVGLLIDVGLNPRLMATRLESLGASWGNIAAVALTHTHGDHVSDQSLLVLARHRIVLVCHEAHVRELARREAFQLLNQNRLVRTYDDRPWLGPGGLRIEAIPVSHDDRPTFGFRIEAREARNRPLFSVGYLADLGTWGEEHSDAVADVNVLAVEFNHDVQLQRRSGRPAYLVARNLSDRGHLSNEQAGALVADALRRSRKGRLHSLVLLHLSEECNRPELAHEAAQQALRQANRRAAIHIAQQGIASPSVLLAPRLTGAATLPALRVPRARQYLAARSQTWLTFS